MPATSDRRPASERDGLFPHKTAATAAGLGWIGKTALFVSPEFGPAVRLATVFTDLDLPAGEPVTEGRCGDCTDCVDACPAGCGRDVAWRAGMRRDELFDASACRHHMTQYTEHRAADLRHLHRRLPALAQGLTPATGHRSGRRRHRCRPPPVVLRCGSLENGFHFQEGVPSHGARHRPDRR